LLWVRARFVGARPSLANAAAGCARRSNDLVNCFAPLEVSFNRGKMLVRGRASSAGYDPLRLRQLWVCDKLKSMLNR
jgi:hypothetical protein